MLTTVTKDIVGVITCGPGGPDMQAGDQVTMTLDTVAVPGLPATVNGVIQMPVLSMQVSDPDCDPPCLVDGTRYIVEYETDDLLGALPELRDCDILSMECVTCCQVLDEKHTALNAAAVVRLDALEAAIDQSTADIIMSGATFVPATGLPLPDIAALGALEKEEGDTIRAVYDPDTNLNTGDEFVVEWTIAGGVPTAPRVVEWPEAQVTKVEMPADSGIFVCTFTDKSGNTIQWVEQPVTVSDVGSETDDNGIVTVTHKNGVGGNVSWISVDPKRVLFHNSNIVGGKLQIVMWDGAAYVAKQFAIEDVP